MRRALNILSLLLILAVTAFGQQNLEIRKVQEGKFIPIGLKGFSPEIAKILGFDLEIQGFKVVEEGRAQYVLSGSNDSKVQGRLQDRISQKEILAKAYSGGNLRLQAHALSDDVVQLVTGVRGIARTKIAFRVKESQTSEIYVADYDGHNARRVTSDGSIVRAPAWAPQGAGLFYCSYRLGNPDIFYHDLRAGKRTAVARYLGTNSGPSVSPDGKHVAMILSLSGKGPDLYVADFDGRNLKRLTFTPEDESAPCWSPDGSTICVVSRKSGRAKLYTIPRTGGEMTQLRTTGVYNATEPDWSPDGKKIAFTTLRGGRFELCLVSSAGGTIEELKVLGEDPSWAPNSRTLSFTNRSGAEWKLSLLDVPTKEVKDVAHLTRGSYSQSAWAR